MKIKLTFFICFLVSCTLQKSQTPEIIKQPSSYSAYLAQDEKKIKFRIDSSIVNRSVCLMPFVSPDSRHYLFYLSGYSNTICVFDINSAILKKKIQIQRMGPDGVGDIKGFEVINFDSIYITSAFRRKLYLADSSAKIISTIDYSKFEQEYFIHAASTKTFENMRIGFNKSKIYLPFYPGYDIGNYKSNLPEDIRFVADIDTLKRKAETLNIGFPNNYWKNNFYPTFFGFFIHSGNFYVNYAYDNLIAVSKDSKNWRFFEVKSKYADVKKVIDREKGLPAAYSRLVPDPYRNIFYRFVRHEQVNFTDRSYTDLIRYPHRFSIIILDKNLKIIGETLFPDDTYLITEEGLYLSLSNPFNPAYNIDFLDFQLFNFYECEK